MSQENVEIAKRAIDAFNRRDVDDLTELTTPDFELFAPMIQVEGGSLRGREGVETVFGNIRDTWEEQRFIAGEFRDLGDRVVVLGRMEAHGRSSGVPVDVPFGNIFDFRDGKISRVRAYRDHGEALRAAGLEG